MDKKGYDEIVKRLKVVNKAVKELDPAIRSAAWDLLRPYVDAAQGEVAAPNNGGGGARGPPGKSPRTLKALDADALLDEHASDHDPVANALLVTAILYGTYGNGPYTPKELVDLGEEHRLPMPLMGNFLRRTKRNDKKVFRNGKDGWVITMDGGKWLAEAYSVKRGSKPKPE